MHGPTRVFWANLTPSLLVAVWRSQTDVLQCWPRTMIEAGLDEGFLALALPIIVCMDNPYRKTNDSDE